MYPANRRKSTSATGPFYSVTGLMKKQAATKKIAGIKRQASNPNSPMNYKKRMTKPSNGKGVGF